MANLIGSNVAKPVEVLESRRFTGRIRKVYAKWQDTEEDKSSVKKTPELKKMPRTVIWAFWHKGQMGGGGKGVY